MATLRTTRLGLMYPGAKGDRDWNQPLVAQVLAIDGFASIGSLCVASVTVGAGPAFAPTGLSVKVSAGSFLDLSGCPVTYAGTAAQAVTPSATTRIWLTASGTLGTGASWPTIPHVRLASVVAGATDITTITDERVTAAVLGQTLATVAADLTLGPGHQTVAVDTTSGAVEVTLPPANGCPGQLYRIKRISAGANNVTITPDGSDTIEGDASRTLSTQWAGLTLIAQGTRWLAF